MILSKRRITKALISMHRGTGWSVLLLFAHPKDGTHMGLVRGKVSITRKCHNHRSQNNAGQLRNWRRTQSVTTHFNWASSRENLSSGGCEQHRRRPACASAQSDQRLCYSRFVKNYMLACYKRNFIFLASLCS